MGIAPKLPIVYSPTHSYLSLCYSGKQCQWLSMYIFLALCRWHGCNFRNVVLRINTKKLDTRKKSKIFLVSQNLIKSIKQCLSGHTWSVASESQQPHPSIHNWHLSQTNTLPLTWVSRIRLENKPETISSKCMHVRQNLFRELQSTPNVPPK